MAKEEWVTVKQEWCDAIGEEVELKEQRVYPNDVIPDPTNYRVVARRCSVDITCNVAGFPCKWAYLNEELDPFVERENKRNQ